MLHVIREFALERLAGAAEAEEIHRRHAEVFLELAQSAAGKLLGPDQKPLLDKLELEHDNIRGALSCAMAEENPTLASGLVAASWRFWQMRGHLTEGRHHAEEALGLAGLEGREKYAALEAAGGIAYWQGDQEGADRFYKDGLRIARTLDDKSTLANAAYNASFPDIITGTDLQAAKLLLDDAVAIYRELDDEAGVAKVLWALAEFYYKERPPAWDTAIGLLIEAGEIFRRRRDNFDLGWDLYVLGVCYTGAARLDEARRAFDEGLAIFSAAQDISGISLLLNGFAVLTFAEGDQVQAARLDGARDALEAISGTGLLRTREYIMPELETAVAQLPETHAEAYREGQAMSAEEAIALARGGERSQPGD
jgi:tetratricopeptide (TPR) repeat protein